MIAAEPLAATQASLAAPPAASDRRAASASRAAPRQLIGVDLGGTAIKLVRCDPDGAIQAELRLDTPSPALPRTVSAALVAAIQRLDPDRLADRVGIGLPGPSDRLGRVARLAINLPQWREVPLADWLEPELGRRVVLANDADCALLGEAWCGAARGFDDVLLLTLGTGVGGAVLIGGKLYRGHAGAAAEPGLICVDPNGPPCHSGNRGSLEQYCSLRGLARLSPLSPEELCRRAAASDAEAQAVWDRYGQWLGIGLSSLIYVLTPQRVLIGGGLSEAWQHFWPALRREVEQRVLDVSLEGVEIRRCALGNAAGSLGAVRLALERFAGWEDGPMTQPANQPREAPPAPLQEPPPVEAVPEPTPELLARAAAVRHAAIALGQLADGERQAALRAMAAALEEEEQAILAANRADLEAAAAEPLAPALVARLKLDAAKLANAIEGIRQVAELEDPVGRRQLHTQLDEGLVLERRTVPLGVLGVIFEARPDAVIQIASLAIRSGNGALLKGGREAQRSCGAIHAALRRGLAASAVDPAVLELLTSRQESLGLLRLDGLVDLIIPRGSNAFVRFIQDHTRIPVLGHADGICHLYVDRSVDERQALRLALDSKTHYPAACNAIETLLVHTDRAATFLPQLVRVMAEAGVELRGDAAAQAHGVIHPAGEDDWSTEYSDLILSVRVVPDLEAALAHIARYGTRHTDAICSSDPVAAERFLAAVDSAGVYLNCSTRFADGFRYGFGAEVGISTQTLPPRGPVGLEGLVTYRYRLRGEGHIAADYSSGARRFQHRSLPL